MKAGRRDKLRIENMDRMRWNSEVAEFADANFQQDWAYFDLLAERRTCQHEEVGIWEGENLLGIASVRIRRIPLLRMGVAYVAGGPLVNRGAEGDLDRFKKCLEALRDEYVRKRKFTLRVLPPIGDCPWNRGANEVMMDLGMAPNRTGRKYRTLLVDLRRPLEAIRSGLAQKWRNCLNSSERESLSVRWTSDLAAFEKFQADHEFFVKSKGFSVDLDAAFYRSVRERESDATSLELAIVEKDGESVAIHLGSYLGDTAVYLLGLTEETALKSKAANFLHWEVIKKAHQRGMRWYDLGGIDPEENPGVFKFKAGFCGDDVQAAGPMEFAPGTLRRCLLQGIEKARAARRG